MFPKVKLSLLSPAPYLISDQVYFGYETIYRLHFLIYLKIHVMYLGKGSGSYNQRLVFSHILLSLSVARISHI